MIVEDEIEGDLVDEAVDEEALKATSGRRVREAEEAVAGAGEVEA